MTNWKEWTGGGVLVAASVYGLWEITKPSIRLAEQCEYSQGPTEERAAFIIECARAANPMSDEEGEDLVAECARHAYHLYPHPRGVCRQTFEYRKTQALQPWTVCDLAEFDSREQRACTAAGWKRSEPQ